MKKTKRIILIIVILFVVTVSVFFVCFFTGYKIYRNVRYGETENEIMDIYIPNKAYDKEYNGCVLFIHGGSWTGGDKKEESFRCRYLASKGYIAATVNYTLYSEETADSYHVGIVLDEIDAALTKIKSFAAEKGITVTKAATSGYSAGAHLSMLYAFSRHETAPMELVFTANMAGPADFSTDIWGKETALTLANRLSGQKVTEEMLLSGQAEEILRSISPTSYITADTPPSIFMYGGRDDLVDKANGESLKAKFDAVGVEYDYIFLPKAKHSLARDLGKRFSYFKRLVEYCKEYFA